MHLPGRGSPRGLAGLAVAGVTAWVLVAVFLLLRILLTAQEIDSRVDFATGQLGPINDDTELVRVAERTDEIAADIAEETAPLSRQLTDIRATASNIDTDAESILTTSREIRRRVGAIRVEAGSVLEHVGAIERRAEGIEASAGTVGRRFADILGVTGEIACGEDIPVSDEPRDQLQRQRQRCGTNGVPGIDRRLDLVILLVGRTSTDLTAVAQQVGRGHGTPLDAPLHGHANSIDCRLLGGHCGE